MVSAILARSNSARSSAPFDFILVISIAEFERAKMAETIGDTSSGVPSYDEVKDKIGGRLAKAEAQAELADADGQTALDGASKMVEKAAMESKAAARLAEIKSQMGIQSDTPQDSVVADDAAGPDDEPS